MQLINSIFNSIFPYFELIIISSVIVITIILIAVFLVWMNKTPKSYVLFIAPNFFDIVKAKENEESIDFEIKNSKGGVKLLSAIKDKDTHPYLYRKFIFMKRIWISIESNPHTVDLTKLIYLLDASRIQQMISYFKDKEVTQSSLSKYRRSGLSDILANLSRTQLKNTIIMFLFGSMTSGVIMFALMSMGVI